MTPGLRLAAAHKYHKWTVMIYTVKIQGLRFQKTTTRLIMHYYSRSCAFILEFKWLNSLCDGKLKHMFEKMLNRC